MRTQALVHQLANEFRKATGAYPRAYEGGRVNTWYRQQVAGFAQAKRKYGLTEQDLASFLTWYYRVNASITWAPFMVQSIIDPASIAQWRADTGR
jgi:hypothetical protein